jgi:S1-C subfamily serine protease
MVRIVPSTLLRLELADTPEAAGAFARNEMLPEGTELWHRAFTRDQMARCDDPRFALAMVNHEFCTLVRQGASFPQTVKLAGGGTGFAVSPAGHVLTNLHLASSEVEHHRREGGALDAEIRCAQLKAEIAVRDATGTWRWRACDSVYLVSNPPFSRGYWQDPDGRWHLREDTALLRVEPAPESFLPLSTRRIAVEEPIWMAGFPMRTARSPAALQSIGYRDADGSLRVSTGRVIGEEAEDYFVSDLDGAAGNSGSPVFDDRGSVVGIFSRWSGNGPSALIEYGHMQRIHVRTALAVSGLGLAAVPGVTIT